MLFFVWEKSSHHDNIISYYTPKLAKMVFIKKTIPWALLAVFMNNSFFLKGPYIINSFINNNN